MRFSIQNLLSLREGQSHVAGLRQYAGRVPARRGAGLPHGLAGRASLLASTASRRRCPCWRRPSRARPAACASAPPSSSRPSPTRVRIAEEWAMVDILSRGPARLRPRPRLPARRVPRARHLDGEDARTLRREPGGDPPRVDGGALHVRGRVLPGARSLRAPQARPEAAPAALDCRRLPRHVYARREARAQDPDLPGLHALRHPAQELRRLPPGLARDAGHAIRARTSASTRSSTWRRRRSRRATTCASRSGGSSRRRRVSSPTRRACRRSSTSSTGACGRTCSRSARTKPSSRRPSPGDPEEVADKIRMHQEALGIDFMMGAFSRGGLAHEKVRRSLKLFGEKVMPRFA